MGKAWAEWGKIAEVIGNFQGKLIFSFLYFIMFTPISLIIRIKSFFQGEKEVTWVKIKDNYSNLEKIKKL